MELGLVQTAPGNATLYLQRLSTRLPAEITARVEFLSLADPEEAELPRLIVRLEDASDADFQAVRAALDDQPNPAFDLTGGGVPAGADLPVGDPLEAAFAPDHLSWAQAPLLSGAQSSMAEALEKIIKGEPSGVDFPERAYEGKEKKCYDYIVGKLGREPLADQGDVLHPGDVRAIDKPRRGYDAKAWAAVVEHLEQEIRFFSYAAGWFGDAGHLRVMYRDRVVLDFDFVEKANSRYKLIPDDTMATLVLDAGMSLTLRAVGAIPGEGPLIAAILNVVWILTKQKLTDHSGAIKGKIRELRGKVADTFAESVRAVETAHAKLVADWGNLQAFGEMVLSGELKWPKDAKKLRNAHALGFQHECMRVLISAKSRSTAGTHERWGVCRLQRQQNKARKRGWDAKKLRLYSKSQESCKKHHYYEYFLGQKSCYVVPMAGLQCNPPKPNSQDLMKKLFGAATGDDLNPDLGISPDFLDKPKSTARKGWDMQEIG